MALIGLTGASSFLGAHYLKHARSRHPEWNFIAQVRSTRLGFSSESIQPLTCDLVGQNSVEVLSKLEPNVVIHMASAITEEDVRDRNALMTRHVLEVCRRCGAKLVFISSSQIVFERHNQYALSKIDAEQMIQESDVQYVVLRPASPYGPLLPDHTPSRQQSMHVLTGTIAKLPAVPVIGNGRYTRQPLHVSDLSEAIDFFIASDLYPNRTYDFGGPEVYSMDQIIGILAASIGKKVLPLHLPKSLFIAASRFVTAFNGDLLSTVDCSEQVDNGPLLSEMKKDSLRSFQDEAKSLFNETTG